MENSRPSGDRSSGRRNKKLGAFIDDDMGLSPNAFRLRGYPH